MDRVNRRMALAAGQVAPTRHRGPGGVFAVREMEITNPTRKTNGVKMGGGSRAWQAEAWEMFDTVGELSFVAQWLQNSCSQVSLYAAEVDDKGQPGPVSNNTLASEIVASIGGGPSGQAELMARSAVPMMIAGEFYIVILQDKGKEDWRVLSPNKVRESATGGITVIVDGEERKLDTTNESVFQVINPHPNDDQEPHSPVRAALPSLREIRAMDMLIQSASKSRIAGNGLLLIPKEVNNPAARAPLGGDAPGIPQEQSAPPTMTRQITRALMAAMEQSMDNVGDPASLTPVTMAVQGDRIDQFRHMQFSQDLTEENRETRERAIARLAKSLDVPAEILTGLGDSTHWNAELVDKQASRQHIAPLLTLICDALTRVILRPLLEAQGNDPDGVVVWFDMSPITEDEGKADRAQQAYEAGALSREAYLRELGFEPEDAAVRDRESIAIGMVERAPSLYPYLWSVLPGNFPPPSADALALEQAIGKGQTVPDEDEPTEDTEGTEGGEDSGNV